MMNTQFVLDAHLAKDSVMFADGQLSQFRLMNDARFPWIILVPRVANVTEWVDLPEHQQNILQTEINLAASLLRKHFSCDKINIGSLGNIVHQLHVHVLVRKVGDEAWPGPVWGHGKPVPYTDHELTALSVKLKLAFDKN